jgi:hypothetical protein
MSRTGKRSEVGKIRSEIRPHIDKWIVSWSISGSTYVMSHEEPTKELAEDFLAGLIKRSSFEHEKTSRP